MRLVTMVGVMMLTMGARAQDPVKSLPKNYRVTFENAQVRVVHVHYGAGEKVPVHDHPKTPTLYVYLSDAGPVKFVHAGDDPFDTTRKPVKAGQWRLSPGRLETHLVKSLSKTDSEFLRVEFKTLPLGLSAMHARSVASAKREGSHVEFEDAHLKIVRLRLGAGRVLREDLAERTAVIPLRAAKLNGVVRKVGDVYDAGDALEINTGGFKGGWVEVLVVTVK